MSWNLRFGRRQWGLRGVQWNLDDFESMEDAIQAADALVQAGIYAHLTNTEAGPVILVSKRDLGRR